MYGERLKNIREEYGLSQNELAKQTKISQQNISLWENNKRIPSIDFCVQLAQYYGISLDELVGLSDNPTTMQKNTLPTKQSDSAIGFANEYADIISDSNFVQAAKLFKAITPELRALALGYIVGLLQNNGVNTKIILGY